jgi:hypothetical protein
MVIPNTQLLYPGDEPRYQLKRGLGGSQEAVLDVLKKREIFCPHWNSNPGSSNS